MSCEHRLGLERLGVHKGVYLGLCPIVSAALLVEVRFRARSGPRATPRGIAAACLARQRGGGIVRRAARILWSTEHHMKRARARGDREGLWREGDGSLGVGRALCHRGAVSARARGDDREGAADVSAPRCDRGFPRVRREVDEFRRLLVLLEAQPSFGALDIELGWRAADDLGGVP